MLDPEQLRAEVQAQQNRLKSPQWASAEDEGDWTQQVQLPLIRPKCEESERRMSTNQEQYVLEQLENLENSVLELKSAIQKMKTEPVHPERTSCPIDDDPRLYDAPTALRQTVCIRILPELYAEVQQCRKDKNFQTTVGVWEYLVRLGLWHQTAGELRRPYSSGK